MTENLRERGHWARVLPTPIGRGPCRAWPCPTLLFLASGFKAKPVELELRCGGLGVAIGLLILQHLPGHHRHTAVLPFAEAAEECPERTGVRTEVLSGLHQHRARVPVPLAGNRAMIT